MNWWYVVFILIGLGTVSYLSEIAEKMAHIISILEEQEAEQQAKPECNCYFSGDQADASDCPLHRR